MITPTALPSRPTAGSSCSSRVPITSLEDNDGVANVFVRDLQAGTTTFV